MVRNVCLVAHIIQREDGALLDGTEGLVYSVASRARTMGGTCLVECSSLALMSGEDVNESDLVSFSGTINATQERGGQNRLRADSVPRCEDFRIADAHEENVEAFKRKIDNPKLWESSVQT